jgi:hypothetical protein
LALAQTRRRESFEDRMFLGNGRKGGRRNSAEVQRKQEMRQSEARILSSWLGEAEVIPGQKCKGSCKNSVLSLMVVGGMNTYYVPGSGMGGCTQRQNHTSKKFLSSRRQGTDWVCYSEGSGASQPWVPSCLQPWSAQKPQQESLLSAFCFLHL